MAKPGSGATITISDSDPHFGEYVSFDVEAGEQFPWIECQCFNVDTGELVYSQVEAGFNHGQVPFPSLFELGPTSLWREGPAHGHATAFLSTRNNRRKVLAETSFEVHP